MHGRRWKALCLLSVPCQAEQVFTAEVDNSSRGRVVRGRRDFLTKAGASCRVRKGTRNYCRECVGLVVHRGQPRQLSPIRSSVRIANSAVRYHQISKNLTILDSKLTLLEVRPPGHHIQNPLQECRGQAGLSFGISSSSCFVRHDPCSLAVRCC